MDVAVQLDAVVAEGLTAVGDQAKIAGGTVHADVPTALDFQRPDRFEDGPASRGEIALGQALRERRRRNQTTDDQPGLPGHFGIATRAVPSHKAMQRVRVSFWFVSKPFPVVTFPGWVYSKVVSLQILSS